VSDLIRGRVVWFELPDVGRKPGVVVSNNTRNRQLRSALVARIITSPKPVLESVIELGQSDPLVGRVLCDDLIEVYDDEVVKDGGALAPGTMRAVDDGLRSALGL